MEEARERIGERGLFVVGDAANLPFIDDIFDGVVSLHTFHHLALADQKRAWGEVFRTLKTGKRAAIVNGWTESEMMRRWQPLVKIAETVGNWIAVLRGKRKPAGKLKKASQKKPTGTFVQKLDAAWIRNELPAVAPGATVMIRCWRSVSVRWLRALIHPPYGKQALRRLFDREEAHPQEFGESGQYPLIVLKKNPL